MGTATANSDMVDNVNRWARLLRYDALRMISNANSGHPGGCLSMADILAYLYFHEMNIKPDNPQWPDRDRFILSKGHAAPMLYAGLARKGYFPMEELKRLRTIGSFLHGHPDMQTPGVDMTSGCLGQGLSAAVGMALAGRYDAKDYRVFVVMGCGELDEGQLWEGAMCASHFKLDRVIGIVDYNQLQFDGTVHEVCHPGDLKARWESLRWNVLEIDGHDVQAIAEAIQKADANRGCPTVIIANTVKGKGCDFMEGDYLWHSLMDEGTLKEFVKGMQYELQCNEDSFYAQRLW